MSSKNFRPPRSFFTIISSEFAERCSYYAIAVLAPVYLTQQLGFANETAQATMYRFTTVAYLTCVLGGIMADWYLGRYRAILLFAWFTVLGHILLGLYLTDKSGFQLGLLAIAIGTGFIKPNVSAMLGDQYSGEANESRIARGFNWFYFAINAGSVLSFSLAPVLPHHPAFGWAGAFSFPAAMMVLALLFFWLGRRNYVHIHPTGTPSTTFVGLNFRALRYYFRYPNESPWKRLEAKYGTEKVDGVLAVWRVTTFFLFIPVAWSVYHTNGIGWLLDAESEYMIKTFFGVKVEAGQLQTVNPICILTFIPISLWVFGRIERRTGNPISTKYKMLLGFVLLLIAILIESWVAHRIELQQPVHAGWQVLAFVVLSAGEILVSISGLQYGYTHAPRNMKSTIGSIWLLTTAVGTGINSSLKNLATTEPAFAFLKSNTSFYLILAVTLAINIIVYWVAMKRIKEKAYI